MRKIALSVLFAAPVVLAFSFASALPVWGGPESPEYDPFVPNPPMGYHPRINPVAGHGMAGGYMGLSGGTSAAWDTQTTTPLAYLASSSSSPVYYYPTAINRSGQLLGIERVITAPLAMLWNTAASSPVLLAGSDNSYEYTSGSAINDAGTVVGNQYADYAADQYGEPVMWKAGSTTAVRMSMPAGAVTAFPQVLNASGFSAGYSTSSASQRQFVRWDPTGRHIILQSPSVPQTHGTGPGNGPVAINASGMAAGTVNSTYVSDFNRTTHAVRWDANGQYTELAPLSVDANGQWQSSVVDMNDSGVVVGITNNRYVRWDAAGVPLELQSGVVAGLDSAGTAVGYRSVNNASRASLWRTTDGTAVDLNSTLTGDDATKWNLLQATSISDTGWITGFGSYDPDGAGPTASYYRLFLLDSYYITGTPGDTSRDGDVNFTDLLTLAQNYNTAAGALWDNGDFNGDGAVNFADLLALAQNYGSSQLHSPTFSSDFSVDWATALSLVPEPASASLLLLGCVLTRKRARRAC